MGEIGIPGNEEPRGQGGGIGQPDDRLPGDRIRPDDGADNGIFTGRERRPDTARSATRRAFRFYRGAPATNQKEERRWKKKQRIYTDSVFRLNSHSNLPTVQSRRNRALHPIVAQPERVGYFRRWEISSWRVEWSGSKKPCSWRMRVGWRILRRALASIWRILSRVTLNWRPTSSRVRL